MHVGSRDAFIHSITTRGIGVQVKLLGGKQDVGRWLPELVDTRDM